MLMIQPALFIGHGSPMNAIETNHYTQNLNKLASNFKNPDAIISISAHWQTRGTLVTAMDKPKTIHDFYGFPKELFDVQYPAPGSPNLANDIVNILSDYQVKLDTDWGLDHGTWSVLKHIYPQANIPIVQLSLDMTKDESYHFKLGQSLRAFREKNILIFASGNIVHNLQKIQWNKNDTPHSWALEFDDWVKQKILQRDFNALQFEYLKSKSGQLSVPTLEHYLPLLYVLGAATDSDQIYFDIEEIQNASISMRSVRFQ